jgi:hypothetical protein
MKKLIVYFLLVLVLPTGLLAIDETVTVGPSGDYPSLNEAFFDINSGLLTGVITIQITGSFTESFAAELFESGYGGSSSYSSVTIYPTGAGYIVDGDIDGPLILLNGADNVTIDGRENATGSTKSLVIVNMSTGASASTIQFIKDATNNTVKYCTIKGSETSPTRGVIFFSTSAVSGNGNDGNTINNNDITSYYDGITLTRPINAIFSLGTSSRENSGITISSNNIYDFLKHGTASNGIFLSSNTTTCTISGNSFYESAPFAPTSSVLYNTINIDNASGTGFIVTGNFIGGRSASCGGSAWTKTNAFNNAFQAINLNVGTSPASNVQNNTIQNFSWSNSSSAAWTGINIALGDVNVGTSAGNTIGSSSGTGSITVTGGASGANVYGINITSTGTVDCENNIIGSITATTAVAAHAINITGIIKSGVGTTIISSNTIGSTSTDGSINASSGSTGSAQVVIGINNAGSGSITISSNIIAKMTNGSTNTSGSSRSRIDGIVSSDGTNTISSNTIRDLTIANANNASNQIASVCGIALTGNTLDKTITDNTIFNLSNTYSSFLGSVVGLFYTGSTGTNSVKGNFIHSLSVTGATSTTASIYGINISSGATTYSNNIISIGGTSKTTIYGIYEPGTLNNNSFLYFNTVFIGGDGNGGTNKTYALYSASNANTRDFRNNIFVNLRETLSTTNKHYAAFIASGGTITCDFNDYLVSQTVNGGGTLGNYGGDKTALPIVTGQDVSSFAIAPSFASAGGTVAANYIPSAATLVSVTGTGITTDYDGGAARSTTFPSMGAFEYSVAPTAFLWTGSLTTDWNTSANWNYSIVPSSSTNAIILNVTNKPIVNEAPATPAECQDLTIKSGAVLTIAAGKALKVNGTLVNSATSTGLVIKSDASGNDGKLINNTAGVQATVELSLSGGTGGSGPIFHYIVPPVETMTVGADVPAAKTNLGITNFLGDLMAYSEVAAAANKDKGWQYFDGYTTGGYTYGPFSSISSTMGYNFRFTADDKITFQGALNAADHTFSSLSFTDQGYNLVGNPYPCNYNLAGVNALTASDNIDNTVYFNHDGTYAYWNVGTGAGTTGYSAVMPPMQGFMVHVTATGQSLNLPAGLKTTGAALPLRSKGISSVKGSSVKKIKLVLNDGVVPDETIVCLIDNATPSFDGDYDAYKFFGGGASTPFIYSELNSVKYAINSIQDPGSSTSIVPLTLVLKSAGTYNIDITEFENLEGVNVSLKHGLDVTSLNNGANYSFTSPAGTYSDFQIIFGNIVTGDEPITTNDDLKTWYNNNFLNIIYPEEVSSSTGNLTVFDAQGKIVFNNSSLSSNPGETVQIPLNLPKGFYITRLLINNEVFVSKIVAL